MCPSASESVEQDICPLTDESVKQDVSLDLFWSQLVSELGDPTIGPKILTYEEVLTQIENQEPDLTPVKEPATVVSSDSSEETDDGNAGDGSKGS